MWLYILYIPSLHDEIAHPRIWIGRHANIDNVVMPTLVHCGTNMLVAQLFQYRICIDVTIIWTMYTASTKFNLYSLLFGIKCVHVSFSVSIYMGLFGIFSVLFGVFSVLIGSFRSFSVFIATVIMFNVRFK